jgi:hypothetical protein
MIIRILYSCEPSEDISTSLDLVFYTVPSKSRSGMFSKLSSCTTSVYRSSFFPVKVKD